jgi:hypothetical protein
LLHDETTARRDHPEGAVHVAFAGRGHADGKVRRGDEAARHEIHGHFVGLRRPEQDDPGVISTEFELPGRAWCHRRTSRRNRIRFAGIVLSMERELSAERKTLG